MKKVYPNEDWCLGCKLCEVYCAAAHSPYRDVHAAFDTPDGCEAAPASGQGYASEKAFLETATANLAPKPRRKPTAAIVVEGDVKHSIAISCRHCPDAPCVEACISGAMQKTEDGMVWCDTTRCVGCMTCVLICPYGAVHKGEGMKTVTKCDLCSSVGEPECVRHCPAFALEYRECEAAQASGRGYASERAFIGDKDSQSGTEQIMEESA